MLFSIVLYHLKLKHVTEIIYSIFGCCMILFGRLISDVEGLLNIFGYGH